MKIYALRTTVQDEEAIVDFADSGAVSSCLIYGRDNPAGLAVPLMAVAQHGYTRTNIVTTDYVSASVRIPIFSIRFRDLLGKRLSQELEFIPCLIKCENDSFPFFAGRTLKTLPLVDPGKSQYRKLASGTSILLKAAYRDPPETGFLICRDVESRGRFVVSDEFRKLCGLYSLNIEFGAPV
ncbi:hypothetical protein [Burkholderia lata]|uniref:hypothetical protein n=1 Tax=Burkholderia lata (strain ATCC 17760 / DSM 23089 / LMG 22485 / NCIMB 9086 / R18194 / 383) TaxID=482957 RepID=UPI001582D1E0|nr:hypothetical protein [Burkholderia lata]